MTTGEKITASDQLSTSNLNATAGVIFAGLGMLGWLTLIAILSSIQFEAYSGDGQRDMIIGLGNGMTYFLKVVTGIIGLLVNGVLSLVGLIVSLLGLNFEPKRLSYIGVGLGGTGILIGLCIVLWRMAAWGVLT